MQTETSLLVVGKFRDCSNLFFFFEKLSYSVEVLSQWKCSQIEIYMRKFDRLIITVGYELVLIEITGRYFVSMKFN